MMELLVTCPSCGDEVYVRVDVAALEDGATAACPECDCEMLLVVTPLCNTDGKVG